MRDVAWRAEERGGEDGEKRAVVFPYRTLGPSDKTEEVGLPSPCSTWQWEPGLAPPTPLLSDLAALACPVPCGERGEKTA